MSHIKVTEYLAVSVYCIWPHGGMLKDGHVSLLRARERASCEHLLPLGAVGVFISIERRSEHFDTVSRVLLKLVFTIKYLHRVVKSPKTSLNRYGVTILHQPWAACSGPSSSPQGSGSAREGDQQTPGRYNDKDKQPYCSLTSWINILTGFQAWPKRWHSPTLPSAERARIDRHRRHEGRLALCTAFVWRLFNAQ